MHFCNTRNLSLVFIALLFRVSFAQNDSGISINFDGVNDYVDPNVLINTYSNNFTIESWVKPTLAHQIDQESTSGNSGTSGQKYLLWPTWRGPHGGIGISVGLNGISVYEHGNGFFCPLLVWAGNLPSWTHVAVVIENKQPKLYVNGQLVKTGLTSPRSNVWPSLGACNQYPGHFGGIGGGVFGYYRGDVDEFRVWNHSRSMLQINENLNTSFDCPPSGLVAYYRFNDGIPFAYNPTYTVALDHSGNNNTATLRNFQTEFNTSNWISPGAANLFTSTVPNNTICAGQTVHLPIVGPNSFTWLPGNFSNSLNPVNPATTTIYTLIAKVGNTCTLVKEYTLGVLPFPASNPQVSQSQICPGYPIQLHLPGFYSYTFEPGNAVGYGTGPMATTTLNSSTTFTATGTTSLGCLLSSTIHVAIVSCTLPALNCDSIYYSQQMNTYQLIASRVGLPFTSTVTSVVLPPNTIGIAIGPSFGFNAPNPTIWANAGFYWYYNGTTFVNTYHTAGGGVWSSGGSKNYIYGKGTAGDIYRYDGTKHATHLITLNGLAYNSYFDIVGDELDNFYASTPNALYIFDSAGSAKCTYPHPSIFLTSGNFAGGLAITGNTVTISNGGSGNLHTGIFSGAFMSYTPSYYPGEAVDFASCAVKINFSTSITALPSGTISCSAPHVSLSVSYANIIGPVTSYSWSGPGIVGPSIFQNIVANVPGTYSCLVKTCPGGTSMATFQVYNSMNNPVITLTSNPPLICTGNSATIIANQGLSYTWTPSGLNTPSLVVTPSVSSQYILSGLNSAGCVSSASMMLIVGQIPTISIAPGGTTICEGNAVTYSASGAQSYTWSPTGVIGNSAKLTPSLSTTYTVSGVQNSCVGSKTVHINVLPNPNIIIASTHTSICQWDTVKFSISGNQNYVWQPGNILSPTLAVRPLSNQVYSVLTQNPSGCLKQNTIAIYVNPLPYLELYASPNPVCRNSVSTLSASGAFTYTWTPGNLTGHTVNVSPTVSTNYVAYGTNQFGCTAYHSIHLSVVPNPTVYIFGTSYTLCSGRTQVIALGGASNYSWYPSSSLSSSISQVVIANPLSTTVYTVSGEHNGCYTSTTIPVYVYPTPILSVVVNNYSVCSGNKIVLSASGANQYTWQPGNYNQSVFSAWPMSNTNYTLTGKNEEGCEEKEIIGIIAQPTPTLHVASMSNKVCDGDTILLTAMGAKNYTWMPGNYFNSSIILRPEQTQTYTLIGFNRPCSDSIQFPLFVVNCDSAALGLSNAVTPPKTQKANFYNINFSVTVANISSQILNNIRLTCDLQSAIPYPCTYTINSAPRLVSGNSLLKTNIHFNGNLEKELTMASTSQLLPSRRDTITFSVLLEPRGFRGQIKTSIVSEAIVKNKYAIADSSNNGFEYDPDRDGNPKNNNELTIIDLDLISFFIPEGFSPNDDGINDKLLVSGLNGKSAKFTVFNRWGDKVYEMEGEQISWDGTCNVNGCPSSQNKLPSSTYYYVLVISEENSSPVTGFVVMQY